MTDMVALQRSGSRTRLRRVAIPAPAAGEVRVAVQVAAVCRTDVLAARGLVACADPVILGHEFAGTIDAVGAAVTGWRRGQRVAAQPIFGCSRCAVCQSGDEINCPRRTMLGIDHDGAFAGFVCLPSRYLHPIPDGLCWAAAAYAEPVAAALAVLDAGLTPGQRGTVLGRNRFADLVVRLLRIAGIGNIHRDEADDQGEDAFDFLIETGLGPGSLDRMVRLARPGGTLILKSRNTRAVELDVLALVQKRLTIRAVNYGSFRKALALLVEGRLDVTDLCGPVYPLSAFEEAFARDAGGETVKVFLDLRGEGEGGGEGDYVRPSR